MPRRVRIGADGKYRASCSARGRPSVDQDRLRLSQTQRTQVQKAHDTLYAVSIDTTDAGHGTYAAFRVKAANLKPMWLQHVGQNKGMFQYSCRQYLTSIPVVMTPSIRT